MYPTKSIEEFTNQTLQNICTNAPKSYRVKAEQELLNREEDLLEERIYNARHHRLDLSRIESIA